MSKSKVESFVNETLARLKGDGDEVIAEKNFRKAKSAFKAQIAVQESNLVDLESLIEEREEALKAAKYPTELIKDNHSYVQGIVDAQRSLDSAIEELATAKETKASMEEVLTSF